MIDDFTGVPLRSEQDDDLFIRETELFHANLARLQEQLTEFLEKIKDDYTRNTT
jgi:hypothetical protein